MALPSSGTISMSDIAEEKKGSGLPAGGYWQNISLRGLSVDSVTDFSYYDGNSLITADYPGTPNSATPHAMSEFYDYANVLSSVEIQPATRYENLTGLRGWEYEYIMHGFGQAAMATYNSTMGNLDGPMTDSLRNNAAQGSIINSPDLSKWGVSSTIGTLACIVHLNYQPSATGSNVAMIVTGTGSNSNSGFTTLTATRSGMTTLALNRTDATYYYGSTGTARIWIWSSVNAGSSETTLSNYLTGDPASLTADSTLFPGGNGSTTANTTTTSRSTWTIS